jgi:hypothetical protein
VSRPFYIVFRFRQLLRETFFEVVGEAKNCRVSCFVRDQKESIGSYRRSVKGFPDIFLKKFGAIDSALPSH